MKKGKFKWISAATCAFERIKHKMTEAPISRLPDFDNVLKVVFNASNVGIGGVLSQGHLVAFFNDKFSDAKRKYSPYMEFYTVVQALWHR